MTAERKPPSVIDFVVRPLIESARRTAVEEMYIPVGRTPKQKAIIACSQAMARMLEIGWPQSELRKLEELWWSIHDDNGRISEVPRG